MMLYIDLVNVCSAMYYTITFSDFSLPYVKTRIPLKSILLKMLFTGLSGVLDFSAKNSSTAFWESINFILLDFRIFSSILAINDLFKISRLKNKKLE